MLDLAAIRTANAERRRLKKVTSPAPWEVSVTDQTELGQLKVVDTAGVRATIRASVIYAGS